MRTDKRGGICFRVDDNKPARQWIEFADLFNRHGLKFCAALCAREEWPGTNPT